MLMIITLYALVTLFLGYSYSGLKIRRDRSEIVIYLVLAIGLILFVTFRDDNLPDYSGYLHGYIMGGDKLEPSFYFIRYIASSLLNNGFHLLLFIYATIGVGLKLYAIKKFAVYQSLSIAVWLSSFFILHDLIQMRASVASAILLIIIPFLQERKYIAASILFVIAFSFHNSAIVFLILFFLKKDTINSKLWIILYIIAVLLNTLSYDYSFMIEKITGLIPLNIFDGSRVEGRINTMAISDSRLGMFNPYILMQTIICFGTLIYKDRVQKVAPYSILALKTCFISIFIYSLNLNVTMRFAELLSIAHIYLVPLIMTWFPQKKSWIAKLLITTICLLWMTNFIFIKGFILP